MFLTISTLLGIVSPKVEARTQLVIEGNVLGYNLYANKPVSLPMLYPSLVRITKILKGKEKSQYVLVLFSGLKKDFAMDKFGPDKILKFELERQTFCDNRIGNLMYPGLTLDDNGKVIETSQTFTLVPGVVKKSLPLKKKVPCYVISE